MGCQEQWRLIVDAPEEYGMKREIELRNAVYISRRVSRRWRENVYWSRAPVCLSVRGRMPTLCTDPAVTWRNGRGVL